MNWNSQRAGPSPPPRDKYTARVEPVMVRLEKFWQRVTDGMKLNELWNAVPGRRPLQLSPLLPGHRFHSYGGSTQAQASL